MVSIWLIIRHSSQVPASVHQCTRIPSRPHPPRQPVSGAELDSFVVLLLPLLLCPSELAPPPVPPPPRATWHLVSAHVPGRVSLPGVPGLLTRTQCQTQPTGDFPDPPKRPPARPSYPVHCVITTSSLLSLLNKAPAFLTKSPHIIQPCPEHQSHFVSMAFPAQQ